MKKTIFLLMIAINIILLTACNGNSPGKEAVRIIEKDQGRTVNVLEIAYNEELNRCIVTFTIEGRNDIAIVNLENHIVGYRSLYLRITDPQELIDYAKDAFDPFVLLNYQKGEGWVVMDE